MALKRPVTLKQAKAFPGAAKRRKSFCERMGGMRAKLTSAKKAKDPKSAINQALAAWDCDKPELLPRKAVSKGIRSRKNPVPPLSKAGARIERKESFRGRTTPDVTYIVYDQDGNRSQTFNKKADAQQHLDLLTLSREDFLNKYPDIRIKVEAIEAEQKKLAVRFRKNPVPPSSKAGRVSFSDRDAISRAADLYERFSGHDAEEIGKINVRPMPRVGVAIGEVDGILYTTTRDGVVEKYIHKFRMRDKPLFVVAPDGKGLFLVGGRYTFTERGIVDESDPLR